MASVDSLPFAQPAARPEQASVSKTASSNSAPSNKTADEPSFADLLDNEVEATSDTDTTTDAAPADPTAIPAQPAPPPATPPVNTAAAVIAALLQAPVDVQAEGEAPAEPAVTTTPTVDAAADPAIATAAPNGQATPKAEISTPVPAPAAPAPAAPVAEATAETVVTQTTSPAVTVAATTTSAQSAKPADAEQDADTAAPEGKPAANADAATPAATEADAAPAPAQPSATPGSTISDQPALLNAADLKPVPPELSQHAPGSSRGAAPTEIDSSTDANANANAGAPKAAGAQSAASGAAPTAAASASTSKPNVQAAAATAADAAPEIKTDAAPSTAASTSFADTFAAARGQSADATRAQASSPQLQSAPAAVAQVYTKFVERFDGRAQRFEVRLDPAELGRVDIRIEIGADKKVHAVLAAHDSAAMTDLMRGQRALERALSDAGIDLADGGLRFELSSDTGRNLAGGQQRGDAWSNDELAHAWRPFSTVDVGVEAAPEDVAAATRNYSRRASRLDLVA